MAQAVDYQPLVLVETVDLPREEWLSYRRQGLGGSDAAAVLGISPFRTARDLYYNKRGLPIEDNEDNWVAMEVGTLLEDLVARIFAKKTGLNVYRRKSMFQHPHHPWMLADLDFLVEMWKAGLSQLTAECERNSGSVYELLKDPKATWRA